MSGPIKLSFSATREFWEMPVVYEGQDLLAIDKPAGLPLVSESPDKPALMDMLHSAIAEGKPWATSRSLTYLRNAYHMDPESSGVLLFASTKEKFVQIADYFSREQRCLAYLVLVHGAPLQNAFEVNAPLGQHPTREDLMRVDRQGKKSKTQCEVVESFDTCTLLRCWPLTFRRHQLRVHLRYAGHPLVGDSSYGGRPLLLSRLKPGYRLKENRTEQPLLDHPLIHAETLTISQPISASEETMAAALPKKAQVAIKYLRKYAGDRGAEPEVSAPEEV